MTIVPNDFPYNLHPEVHHHVLWSTDRFPHSRYQQFAEQRFSNDCYDVIMFENVKANKSVKSVHHLHLLVREKPCAHAQNCSIETDLRPKMWPLPKFCLMALWRRDRDS